MAKLLDGKRLTLGVCYYPEHWPEEMWREDLQRMQAAGIETVRIGEFAWNLVEPREGEFTYDFFDRFLDLTDAMGMQVIMGTPTATPPAWLTERYPEVLNARVDGALYRHGMRRHYNYNSPVYREFAARITEAYASHYARRESVIGWQIDNELNCEIDRFYSESDTAAFRRFLQEKYGTLDALNEAWGTVFWNQTYTAWEEIYVPRNTIQGTTNPHQTLDYLRFVSDSACTFAGLQAEILRKYVKSGDFITTNGIFGHLDYQRFRRESLDFITYDSYPNFAYGVYGFDQNERNLRDRWWSKNLSETRAISPVFGIMEQQSGANGWNTGMEAPTPRPGQITLWTMQSVAHGADFISYFRWRTATFGTEMYWHGILDYSGRDNRRLREVTDIHEKFEKLAPVAGSRYEAKVAILRDYDNIWDAEVDVWHGNVERPSQDALFAALQRSHTPFDYLYVTKETSVKDLQEYKVIFWPHPAIMTPEQAALLEQYVAAGGTLILGCRSAYKDVDGHCSMDLRPGLLRKLTGADIPEYSAIAPDAGKVLVDWDDETFEAAVFTELLKAVGESAETVGRFVTDYYAGSGALVVNHFGQGTVYYYGSAFTEEAARVFLNRLEVAEPYDSIVTLPECCEITVRRKGDRSFVFLLNYSKEEAACILHSEVTDLYSGEKVSGEMILEGYGTRVLELR